MMNPTTIAEASIRTLSLFVVMFSLPVHSLAQQADWVTKSNEYAKPALDAVAKYAPEFAGRIGVEGVDEAITDLRPGYVDRQIEEFETLLRGYRKSLKSENDARVKYDLQILIGALEDNIESLRVNRKHMLPYTDIAQTIFFGINNLMDPQVDEARRPAALVRLRRYAGMDKGYEPFADRARAITTKAEANAALVGPYTAEIDRHLSTYAQYMSGIRELFEASDFEGWQAPLDALEKQIDAYYEWVDTSVRARARQTSPLPYEVYKDNLKQVGVDMEPEELIRIATAGYRDIQNEMTVLAGMIAEERGFESNDYRDVIRELKKIHRVPGDEAVAFYKDVLASIEEIIVREDLVTLPKRKAGIEFASKARSAATPAPFMQVPRMLNNTGEFPVFMIPHLDPDEDGNWPEADTLFTDFAWALTAHEARPGHEMQFSAIIENGVSHIRAIFALNSANAEGWGLYSEAIMKPFFSLEAQLIALQARLMRAGRMFLDPMVNTGRISAEDVYRVITEDILVGESLAQQEVQRYTFWAPGQATSYYYGYHFLQALRAETEVLLADKFVQREFHDFILAQGMLPPALMKNAVMENYVAPRLSD